MLVLDMRNVKKYYGHRLILDIEDLRIHQADRIGLVGLNGSGKTTLLNLISQDIKPDEGFINIQGNTAYIRQLADAPRGEIHGKYLSQLGLRDKENYHMSGGEISRLKLAQALSEDFSLLLADEPTTNLDLKGINMLGEKLLSLDRPLLLVSHDRGLLDKVCNKIFQIDGGKITVYQGNYSQYQEQREIEIKSQQAEYEGYIQEKRRLERAIIDTENKSRAIRDVPRRMGVSEARLHKMGSQNAKGNLDKKAKAIRTRLGQLEVKEKVKDIDKIKLDISPGEIHSRILIEARNISKSFGDRLLFKNANFQVYNGSKLAIMGDNGTGKTTLLKMILNREEGIWLSKRAKIGYFSQALSILDEDKTIIENIMENSIYDENTARLLLARILFKGNDIYKKVRVLSGGEKVKASLAKILVSDFNILILDEPTNYLDIYSIEAMEKALADYEGTIIFVSHDKRFIEKIADHILWIEDKRIKSFQAGLRELENRKREAQENRPKELAERKSILEYRLSEILGRLSMPNGDEDMETLDKEYGKILRELNALKNQEN